MKHKGVRYEIRIGIASEQWLVAIYLPDKKLWTVVGTRRDAEIEASSIIDAWMRKRRVASRRRGLSRPSGSAFFDLQLIMVCLN